jgi:threonine dehydratase
MTATQRRVELPSPQDLQDARRVVAEHLPPTPVVPVRLPGVGGSDGSEGEVLLKLETMQPTGSFKVRGALVALTAHGDRPVITASAGNHGLGVAYAAQRLGVRATVRPRRRRPR